MRNAPSKSVTRYMTFKDVKIVQYKNLKYSLTPFGLRLVRICAEQVQYNNVVEYVERRNASGEVFASGSINNPMRF